ncbi:hypothetical protein FDI21_gp205 [Pseudomonas phage Noxifer]|uniref:Uncharacterized protein n=1 Tax=Pseudomonas phage Noxifer TaxID=2006684 RepID=A0A1Y0SXM7_9CAUD|nr:hypothetical protein FDI21_gp205 [Pseudomonas phage Noxifer]ARV77374.1 hypothetical protein NOXIFER_205 [Pseudomonas phage Noxifer]
MSQEWPVNARYIPMSTFNNPYVYKRPMPAELADNRLWQLAYGEFRAPKYMAVMRDYIDNFDWDNVKESDVAMAQKLMIVWVLIPQNRMLEWPTMAQKLNEFAIRLRKLYNDWYYKYHNASIDMVWIVNDVEWYALIEEPYARLHP